MKTRLIRLVLVLTPVLVCAVALGLYFGERRIGWNEYQTDELARMLLVRLRLPRVLMAALVGGTLAASGAALQALFRNGLADPFTLGVSGGGALGASAAIALGWSTQMAGVPALFVCAFAGALATVVVVQGIARGGAGTLLLAGVVMNLMAAAGVVTIQYMTEPAKALQILRWVIGSLDVVGYELVGQMALAIVPALAGLLWMAPELHLVAVDAEAAVTLGVRVKRTETIVHVLTSLLVGVTVAVGGAIGFVGLIVPHAVRLVFGEDLRVVLPGSVLLGGAFLIGADAVARTALGGAELPVGAVTALLGGPVFLMLLRRRGVAR